MGQQNEMTTGQIYRMLDEAREIGMTDYVIWGGEPLLRKDLPDIIAHADDLGLDATVITNGSRLAERIDEFADDLYGLIVSIDHAGPTVHEQMRGRRGLFHRAIEGIEKAKEYEHLNIFINCVINRKNIDTLDDIAKLAQRMGIKSSYEMMEIIKGYNERLAINEVEVKDAALRLLQLKEKGWSIANSAAYLRALAGHCRYSCQVPKVLVTVQWDGRVRICSNIVEEAKGIGIDFELGNVTQQGLKEIFQSENYAKYVRRAEGCWKCDLSYTREISLMYSFNREAIGNFIARIV